MSERQDLINDIEAVVLEQQRDAAWHQEMNALLSRIRVYLRDNISSREAGKKGGAAAKALMGSDGYAEMGRKGGLVVKERGYDYYRDIGRLGSEKRFGKKD